MKKARSFVAAGAAFVVLAAALMMSFSCQAFGQWPVEYDVDRKGGDIRSFWLAEAKYQLCEYACVQEKGCKAYTYVKPGVQGPQAKCWLKNYKARKVPNQTCCISGANNVQSQWVGNWWAYSFGDVYLSQDEDDQLSGKYSDGGRMWGIEGSDGKLYFRFQTSDGKAGGEGVWFIADAAKRTYWGKKCYGFGCNPDGGYGVARK